MTAVDLRSTDGAVMGALLEVSGHCIRKIRHAFEHVRRTNAPDSAPELSSAGADNEGEVYGDTSNSEDGLPSVLYVSREDAKNR
jgi:hypothetical protein